MKWSVNIFRKKKIYKDTSFPAAQILHIYTLLVTKKDHILTYFQMSYS